MQLINILPQAGDCFEDQRIQRGLVEDPEHNVPSYEGIILSPKRMVLMKEVDWLELPEEVRARLVPTNRMFAASVDALQDSERMVFIQRIEELFLDWAKQFSAKSEIEILFSGSQWIEVNDPSSPWQLCFRPSVGRVEFRSVFDCGYPAPALFIKQ